MQQNARVRLNIVPRIGRRTSAVLVIPRWAATLFFAAVWPYVTTLLRQFPSRDRLISRNKRWENPRENAGDHE